jgi:ribosomal protein L40E
MLSLNQPHCPQCLASLPLRSVFRRTPSGYFGVMLGRIGVECSSCGAKLCIIQTRVAVTAWVLLFVFLLGAKGLTSLMHQARLDATARLQLLCVCGAGIGMLLLRLIAPSLWRVRLLSVDEVVTFPLGAPKAEEDAAPGWVCHKCRERNPENFELCWKCGHLRPKSPTSK